MGRRSTACLPAAVTQTRHQRTPKPPVCISAAVCPDHVCPPFVAIPRPLTCATTHRGRHHLRRATPAARRWRFRCVPRGCWSRGGQRTGFTVCTPQRSRHGGLRDSLVRAPTAHPPAHPTPIPHRLLVCVPSVRWLTPVLCALVGSRAALPVTVVVSTGSAPVVVVKLRTTHSRRHHGVQHTAQMGDRPRERGVRHRRR